MRTDGEKNLQNNSRKSEIRTFEKKFKVKVVEKDFDAAKEILGKTFSLYDKAAKTGTFHRNRADRKKSRLTLFLDKAVKG